MRGRRQYYINIDRAAACYITDQLYQIGKTARLDLLLAFSGVVLAPLCAQLRFGSTALPDLVWSVVPLTKCGQANGGMRCVVIKKICEKWIKCPIIIESEAIEVRNDRTDRWFD